MPHPIPDLDSPPPVRVLAVDDSVVMRGALRQVFAAHALRPAPGVPPIELCGMVEDGIACLEAVRSLHPDVLVLDLEMPRMHGLDVLERLRIAEPSLPVILLSAYTEAGARLTIEALALGAREYLTKPARQSGARAALDELSAQLLPKIAALAGSRGRLSRAEPPSVPAAWQPQSDPTPIELVAIGLSTGGPSALERVLPGLPANFPVPVVIAQHMPKLFTGALAERLDRCCRLRVREARHGDQIAGGSIWLAPGDSDMELVPHSAAGLRSASVRLGKRHADPYCRPSVDVLFRSAARVYGSATLALVMTGMGSDGLAGARQVYAAGGAVLAQDAATSAVWGMPGRVFEAGLTRELLPLDSIARELSARVYARRAIAPHLRETQRSGAAHALP